MNEALIYWYMMITIENRYKLHKRFPLYTEGVNELRVFKIRHILSVVKTYKFMREERRKDDSDKL